MLIMHDVRIYRQIIPKCNKTTFTGNLANKTHEIKINKFISNVIINNKGLFKF